MEKAFKGQTRIVNHMQKDGIIVLHMVAHIKRCFEGPVRMSTHMHKGLPSYLLQTLPPMSTRALHPHELRMPLLFMFLILWDTWRHSASSTPIPAT